MILIADSGSTKTEWSLIHKDNVINTIKTSGINPFYQSPDEIVKCLQAELQPHLTASPDQIYFYGAGCANPEKIALVKEAISRVFVSHKIMVGSDLLGAARSLCQTTPGIACILGTGSNSCYYDGKEIVANVSPLGFILGDEGSGAVLGRKLVADVLKKQLPAEVCNLFFDTYKIEAAEILDNVYKKPFPSRYLANFTRFISGNIHIPELNELVIQSFNEFIVRNILQYKQVYSVKINFTGSIAYHFQDQLRKSLHNNNLVTGEIVQAPMLQLAAYHIQNQ